MYSLIDFFLSLFSFWIDSFTMKYTFKESIQHLQSCAFTFNLESLFKQGDGFFTESLTTHQLPTKKEDQKYSATLTDQWHLLFYKMAPNTKHWKLMSGYPVENIVEMESMVALVAFFSIAPNAKVNRSSKTSFAMHAKKPLFEENWHAE